MRADYLKDSFINYPHIQEPVCIQCGQRAKTYYLIPERLCVECYQQKKAEYEKAKIKEEIDRSQHG